MPYDLESDSQDKPEPWASGDSWRGDEQPADDEAWTTEEAESWDVEGDEEPNETAEWRGNTHFADWPEELAGPEYWLYKRIIE
jgi:hypothetical protein